MQKIPRCRKVPKPIEKNTKNTTLSQSPKTNRKKYKKYHAVATVPKPIEKIQKIPRCRNSSKTYRKI